MRSRLVFATAVAATLALALGGCTEEQVADVAICKEVAKVALGSPSDFEITSEEVDPTSEGIDVMLEIAYTDASGATVNTRERCWFRGQGLETTLAEFYREQDGKLVKVPDEELTQLKAQVSG